MKKSEALNLIDDVLAKHEIESVFAAEEILEALEKAGCYPPCRRDGKLDWDPE